MAEPNDVKSIFLDASEKPLAERNAFLDQATGGDAVLRARVAALLKAHDNPDSFLEDPAAEFGATIDLSPAESPLAERPGTLIGPYKLLEQIGEGGMGVVYMAEQQMPVRRRVALKVIKTGMDTRQVIARFEAERQALALMDHSNIARVLDAGATETGRPYFVMELVRGIPITEYCDQNNLPVHERLELFVQVCHAVQHAHQKGIIHRDLKPSNVLVTLNDGRAVPKVIDFGVAKATGQQLTEKTLFTAFAQMVGTPLYMSPEQAEMTSLDIDTRSDIYSLGVLLYELLTGTTPFDQKRMHAAAFDEIRRIIREEEPPKPSTRISTLGESRTATAAHRQVDAHGLGRLMEGDLDWIVMKCLEKDRTRRYQTATGLAEDVHRYLTDQPVKAGRPTRTYRLKKFIRRNRVGVLAGSATAVALMLGLILASVGFLQARRQAEIAHTEAVRADRAAVRATAVNDFLQQMLQSANPDELKGQEYTLRQLLDDFSAGLSDQLASQPEVEADLQKTIGLSYRRLDTQKCEQHLRRAMELRRSLVGDRHEEFADSMVDYAVAVAEQLRPGDAEPYLRSALAIYQKQQTRGRPVIRALQILQIVLQQQNRLSEIEPVVDQALAIANQTPDEQFPEIASIYHGLIIAKIAESKYADAETLGRTCVAMHLRLHGQDHPETGWGYYNLGRALAARHKFAEAIEVYRQAAEVFRRALSSGNWNTASTLEALNAALQLSGKSDRLTEHFDSPRTLDELETLYRESLSDNMDLSDAGQAQVAIAVESGLAVLADIYLKLGAQFAAAGKTDSAEKCGGKARALREEVRLLDLKVAEHVKVFELQLLESDPEDPKLPRKAELIQQRGRQLLESDPADPVVLNQYAWILTTAPDPDLRDPPLAVELAGKGVRLSPNDGNIWNTLGVARYRAGKWQPAVESFAKSMELRAGGDANNWFFLAMAHWQLDQMDEARMWFNKSVEWMDKNQPKNEELLRFRAEAAELLGISEPATSTDAATQP